MHAKELQALVNEAQLYELHKAPYWSRLLQYDTLPFGKTAQSGVTSETFFLSENGASNPAVELEATLRAFYTPITDDPNKHPRCIFPARYTWLKQKLNWPNVDLPIESCSRYWKWANQGKTQSISLFFANGYMENPASFFGHALIRFNTSQKERSELFDTSIDYGAVIPENENALIYISKGLFGGYSAGYSDQKFYHKNHNYGESQLRDLWEYELNLNPEQIQMLTEQLWELMPNKFTYYFTIKNCGSAIASLLESLTHEEKLYSRGRPWVLPSEMFHKLHQLDEKNGLIKRISYHPSRYTRFTSRFNSLSKGNKLALKSYVTEEPERFYELEETAKKEVLLVLLDYSNLLKATPNHERNAIELRNRILKDRLQLSVGNPSENTTVLYTEKNPPHKDPLSSMLRTTIGTLNGNSYGTLQYRPLQYDALSFGSNQAKYSALSFIDSTWYVNEKGTVSLDSLDVLSIRAINPRTTGLPGDSPYSWALTLNYSDKAIACQHCKTLNIGAGYGSAWELNSSVVFYAMLNAYINRNFATNAELSLAPQIGIFGQMNARIKWRAEFKHETDQTNSYDLLEIEARFRLSKNSDVLFYFEQGLTQKVDIGFSVYF